MLREEPRVAAADLIRDSPSEPMHQQLTAPLLSELRSAGFDYASLDDLRRSKTRYQAAIPILVSWLPRVDDAGVKESIVRTLTVPWAKGIATRAVLDEFDNAAGNPMGLRWAIGNAMEVIADSPVADEILRIVADPSNGGARQMFILALGRLRYRPAIPVLIELLKQEEVAGHAAEALGKTKAEEAKSALRTMIDSRPWVRKAAQTALGRMSKSDR